MSKAPQRPGMDAGSISYSCRPAWGAPVSCDELFAGDTFRGMPPFQCLADVWLVHQIAAAYVGGSSNCILSSFIYSLRKCTSTSRRESWMIF